MRRITSNPLEMSTRQNSIFSKNAPCVYEFTSLSHVSNLAFGLTKSAFSLKKKSSKVSKNSL